MTYRESTTKRFVYLLVIPGGHRLLHGGAVVSATELVDNAFGLHPTAVEDSVHAHQRAKLERFDGCC
jgi:hypothetical protein